MARLMLRVVIGLAASIALTAGSYGQNGRDENLQQRFSENSTRKKRSKPEGLAVRAGSAIKWERKLAVALKKSADSGKPIFWYVPSLSNSFMDRKPVIDGYMMSGPFSWPAIIELINQNYIPLKCVPDRTEAARYGLEPYQFVEPGFLIAGESGVLQRSDRLSTLHPQWLFSLISRPLGEVKSWDAMAGGDRTSISAAWRDFVSGKPLASEINVDESGKMELELLRGMELFRSGQHRNAAIHWNEAASRYPDHPLAWKAAMESQGIGPFVRGFEVFGELDERQTMAGVESAGSAAPAGTFSSREVWNRSARFLLSMQRNDGAFVDSDYDFGGFDSLPNVHMAVTAICGWAMLEAIEKTDPGLRTELIDAVTRAADFCANDSHVNDSDRDEVLWAEAYRLRFLAAVSKSDSIANPGEYMDRVPAIAIRLQDLQLENGSWFHEYANAFVTATALIALKDAEEAGAGIENELVKRGIARLEHQRFDNGAYPYSTRPERGGNRQEPVPASAGRIPLCSFALFRWDAASAKQLEDAASTGIEHHDLLAKALKYDNHTDTYAYGGFFFWYDMHARSEAIAAMNDGDRKSELVAKQRELILLLPEIDGCFIDSHELGRCYGTSMALLSLGLMESARKDVN